MRLYARVEQRRRNGAGALLVLGSLPFLALWVAPKVIRFAREGPFVPSAPGAGGWFVIALFGAAIWNFHRVRSKPRQFVTVDLAAREMRMGAKGAVQPLARIGPLRMVERVNTVRSSAGGPGDTHTRPGSTSYAVGFDGLGGYEICDVFSEVRARRRMERFARASGLASITLGGIERAADEIDLSLIDRVRRQGETVARPVAPASTSIKVDVTGDTVTITSRHVATFPLVLAAIPIVVVAMVGAPVGRIVLADWRSSGAMSAVTGVLPLAVPALLWIAWQLRDAVFHGRIVVTPARVRYRFAGARLEQVEEISARTGGGLRLWTDRGPVVVGAAFCPPGQFGYLVQLLRWAIVEAGRGVQTIR